MINHCFTLKVENYNNGKKSFTYKKEFKCSTEDDFLAKRKDFTDQAEELLLKDGVDITIERYHCDFIYVSPSEGIIRFIDLRHDYYDCDYYDNMIKKINIFRHAKNYFNLLFYGKKYDNYEKIE